ncbi:hypothetical protein [Novosphingobium sp. KACC 22771]|uniref:hypothetical protein n=1 Tax=Novosphingobium sp. KACC 22771 TaxID=3025670 RepID=UPI0023659814|nr:hypothetical protein [Novosphingobium sp. KACC 22771]WDF71491.1 hypothetical protein PQ467_11805 [Novosphingobium sp. KACC 22771]
MRRIAVISAAAFLSLALAGCDSAPVAPQIDYDTDQPAPQPQAAAPADHTLRDGLIGGALGYMAGRASQPRPQVQVVNHHVYHPAYRPPAYRPSPAARTYRTTTIIRSYRRR